MSKGGTQVQEEHKINSSRGCMNSSIPPLPASPQAQEWWWLSGTFHLPVQVFVSSCILIKSVILVPGDGGEGELQHYPQEPGSTGIQQSHSKTWFMGWDPSALPCPLLSELSCLVPCPPLSSGGWGHSAVTRKDLAAQLDSLSTPALLTWMAVGPCPAWPCSHTSLTDPSDQGCWQPPPHLQLLLWLQESHCIPA